MFSPKDIKDLREKTGAGMLDCKKALEATEGNIDAAIDWLREKGMSKALKKSERIAAEGLCQIKELDNKVAIVEVNSETDFVSRNEEFKGFVDLLLDTILNNEVSSMDDVLNINVNNETISEILTNLIAKIGEKISFRRFEKVEVRDNQVVGTYIHMGGKIGSIILANGTNKEATRDIAMHAAAMRPLYLKREEVSNEEIEHEKKIAYEQAINEGKPDNIATKMVDGRVNKYFKEVCLLEQSFVKDDKLTVADFSKNSGLEVIKMVRYEVGEGIEKRQENFAEEVMNQING